MRDLLLTDNGDITFEDVQLYKNSFELNFITSKSNALTLNFHIENLLDNNISDGLTINFGVYIPTNNKTIRIVEDSEYIEQAIKIRLKTPLGTLKNNTLIGSKLDNHKHRYIDDKSLVSDIKSCVKTAIEDILPDAIIEIEKIPTIYLDYNNSLKVVIYDKDKKYNYYL